MKLMVRTGRQYGISYIELISSFRLTNEEHMNIFARFVVAIGSASLIQLACHCCFR